MGPLAGMKVIELAGIGPGPMCAMLLADLGAEVLRIDRTEPSGLGSPRPLRFNLTLRNRPVIALDLKDKAAIDLTLQLVANADALIEGFRPGVTERLGLGPDVCLARNKRLVYGRMTGWGQDGPLAHAAGHDLNYIALAGALHAIGRHGQPPTPPLNLVGDFGGGALYLAFGVMCAMFEASRSGLGQIVDAAMVDGVASLMTSYYGGHAGGLISEERGTNTTDSGAYYYDVYECADGRYVSVAAIEAKFHAELFRLLEVDVAALPKQWDKANWPTVRALLEGSDSCFAPVLSPSEAPRHPHNVARATFIEVDGVIQPAPAPRFSRSVADRPAAAEPAGTRPAEEVLAGWLDPAAIAAAREHGVLR